VLPPGGAAVVYVTLPTELLEPLEATRLALARLQRRRDALAEQFAEAAAARGGLVRGLYQLLGKLEPTAYVWTR
jgi:hypothetical protein